MEEANLEWMSADIHFNSFQGGLGEVLREAQHLGDPGVWVLRSPGLDRLLDEVVEDGNFVTRGFMLVPEPRVVGAHSGEKRKNIRTSVRYVRGGRVDKLEVMLQ